MIIMVAFNWSHEPGTCTEPCSALFCQPHSHPAVVRLSFFRHGKTADAGAEGAGSVGRAEVRILVSAQQLTPPRGNEGGAPHPITQGRGDHCVLL